MRHGKTNEISRFRNTENITKSLAEIHSGLIHSGRPDNYQGISIYANWVTESNEWRFLKKEFFASE